MHRAGAPVEAPAGKRGAADPARQDAEGLGRLGSPAAPSQDMCSPDVEVGTAARLRTRHFVENSCMHGVLLPGRTAVHVGQ